VLKASDNLTASISPCEPEGRSSLIIRLNQQESKKALGYFWKQSERLAPVRLSEIGDLVCPGLVTTLPLRLYLQSVVCYSLGLYDACIAAACMATEFSLCDKMKRIGSESHGLSDTIPIFFKSEDDKEAWEKEFERDLGKIRAKPYGPLITLARTDPRFKSLAPILDDHQRMNKIRRAYLHQNPDNLRELFVDSVGENTKNVPPQYEKLAKGIALGIRRIQPSDQALAALRIAAKLLAFEEIDMNQSLSSLDTFKRALRSLEPF
jgi:hypothetical protein